MNLGVDSKIWRAMIASTGAPESTGTQAGKVLDMAGFDAVMWIAVLETSTASSTGVGKLYHMHSDSTSTTDMVSCTGAAYIAETTSLSDKMLILDVQKPQKRYVSCYLYRDATARADVIGIQYKAHNAPITQDTSTYGSMETVVAVSPTT